MHPKHLKDRISRARKTKTTPATTLKCFSWVTKNTRRPYLIEKPTNGIKYRDKLVWLFCCTAFRQYFCLVLQCNTEHIFRVPISLTWWSVCNIGMIYIFLINKRYSVAECMIINDNMFNSVADKKNLCELLNLALMKIFERYWLLNDNVTWWDG